ncbi:bifunctional transcriptional activator/DNA repair enzyme AdaA [Streptomyces sp. WAC06614]|uniref:bifunctional transcriptional activator/DNA repair enzyme AdaA n=1 Tax=Streptomyces sp. WAC06614 TaxID=2487416 RepID=UPI000F7717FE|nr:Ada metal-binding domain-containing protein [Streptomyces sp. WAC06614]RSS80404.1 helix-turn-helix domain-containing protein [Streptomyces sp. WAC06614]
MTHEEPFADDEARWAAVAGRDRRADGAFCYGVLTTRTYSRPSCGARAAHRANTVFFPGPEAARRAGFRPCRRCLPDGPGRAAAGTAAVVRSCRLLEAPGPPPALAELAAASGFSRFHLHRVFTATTGITPGTYAAACRAERLRRALPAARTVTEAVYQAGFESTAHFYAVARDLLGMSPTVFRDRGRGVAIRYALAVHGTGAVLAATTPDGVCAVLGGPDGEPDAEPLVRRLRERFDRAPAPVADPALGRQLTALLREAPEAGRDLPADIRGRALRAWLRTHMTPVPGRGPGAGRGRDRARGRGEDAHRDRRRTREAHV